MCGFCFCFHSVIGCTVHPVRLRPFRMTMLFINTVFHSVTLFHLLTFTRPVASMCILFIFLCVGRICVVSYQLHVKMNVFLDASTQYILLLLLLVAFIFITTFLHVSQLIWVRKPVNVIQCFHCIYNKMLKLCILKWE